jgi:hypothetical protein
METRKEGRGRQRRTKGGGKNKNKPLGNFLNAKKWKAYFYFYDALIKSFYDTSLCGGERGEREGGGEERKSKAFHNVIAGGIFLHREGMTYRGETYSGSLKTLCLYPVYISLSTSLPIYEEPRKRRSFQLTRALRDMTVRRE